jgi:hypothetical protein
VTYIYHLRNCEYLLTNDNKQHKKIRMCLPTNNKSRFVLVHTFGSVCVDGNYLFGGLAREMIKEVVNGVAHNVVVNLES